ncbi:VOC family protein [Streptomyces sp. NPDC054796]
MTGAVTRHGYTGHTRGTPCWASLMVRGLAAAQEFYQSLFGWEFRSGPQQWGPYARALLDGREVAGLGEMAPARRFRVEWTPYLATENADVTASLIRQCGGTVAVGPLDAEDAGRVAMASDPVGAAFGVWQAEAHLGLGTAERDTPGVPVWYELVCRDTWPAGKFYPDVFGFDVDATEAARTGGLDYLTLRLDGEPVAGVHGVGQALPRDRGPHWKTYFAVEDAEKAARRVQSLGGRVLEGPRDSACGRVATVTDPEGARFSVIQRQA